MAALAVALALVSLVGVTQHIMTYDREARYASQHDGHQQSAPQAMDRYRLRLTPTFDAEADPFALGRPGEDESVRLLVRSGDRELLRRTSDVHRGEPIEIMDVAFAGDRAELFVMAAPAAQDFGREIGMRIEIYRVSDGVLCDDRTLWAPAGDSLSQRLMLSLQPGRTASEAGEVTDA